MQFDLFNESTWEASISEQDIIRRVKNKVFGHIGQLIGEVRDLRQTIESSNKDVFDQEEYKVAAALLANHPIAAKQMEVSIVFPSDGIGKVLGDIDFVLNTWADNNNRDITYKVVIERLRELKPYLREKSLFSREHRADNLKKLTSIKVSGNEAWKLYYQQYHFSTYWHNAWQKLQGKVEEAINENNQEDSKQDYLDE